MSFRRGNSRNKEQFGEDEGDDDQGGADRGGHVQAEQQHRDRHRRQSGGPVPMRQAVPLRWVGTSIRSPATTMRTAKPPKVIAGGNSPFTAAPAKTAGNPASANAAATRQFTRSSPILPKPPNSAAQPTTSSDIGTAWQQRRGDAGTPPSHAVHHDRAIGGQLRQAGSQLRERNRDRSRDSAGGMFGRVADVQYGDLPRCPEPVQSVGVDPRRAAHQVGQLGGEAVVTDGEAADHRIRPDPRQPQRGRLFVTGAGEHREAVADIGDDAAGLGEAAVESDVHRTGQVCGGAILGRAWMTRIPEASSARSRAAGSVETRRSRSRIGCQDLFSAASVWKCCGAAADRW